MSFTISQFVQIAETGGRLQLGEEKGVPTLQTARDGFKGKILSFLSHIPLLKNLSVIANYVQQLKIDNTQVLGVFIHALSARYGEKAVHCAMMRNNIDLTGKTPLSQRTVESLVHDAQISICGFENLGNTCYANSSLKFLISSIGAEKIIAHLEAKRIDKDIADNKEKLDSLNKFIDVITQSQTSSQPLKQELKDFFVSLQKLEGFNEKVKENGKDTEEYEFTIIGQQNDAQEFLVKLAALFKLDEIPSHCAELRETLVNGDKTRSKDGPMAYSQDVTITDSEVTLQDIIAQTHQSEAGLKIWWQDDDLEKTMVEKQKQWVINIEQCSRFNLHINALKFNKDTLSTDKVTLNQVDFAAKVTLPVIDKETGKAWSVTLEPREIIIQRGKAGSGHYYMYTKQNDNTWLKHDDDSVSLYSEIPKGEQAKFISFAILDKEER